MAGRSLNRLYITPEIVFFKPQKPILSVMLVALHVALVLFFLKRNIKTVKNLPLHLKIENNFVV